MSDIREQVRDLHSPDPVERLRAAAGLGRLGARVRETHETLASEYRSAVTSLAGALRDPESPLIRAEAAWALGRIGGLAALRRLLPRVEELFPVPGAGGQTLGAETSPAEEAADAIATLIAAVGKVLSEEVLAGLDAEDIAGLSRARESLLRHLTLAGTDDDVRVAIVETLTILSARARKAGLDMPTDLAPLLCPGGRDAILAAIALLRESAPDAGAVARRWHQRTGWQVPEDAVSALVETWEAQLGVCGPDRATLLEWLDMAAIVWDLQAAAEIAP